MFYSTSLQNYIAMKSDILFVCIYKNMKEMFPRYNMDIDVMNRIKSSTTYCCATSRNMVKVPQVSVV